MRRLPSPPFFLRATPVNSASLRVPPSPPVVWARSNGPATFRLGDGLTSDEAVYDRFGCVSTQACASRRSPSPTPKRECPPMSIAVLPAPSAAAAHAPSGASSAAPTGPLQQRPTIALVPPPRQQRGAICPPRAPFDR